MTLAMKWAVFGVCCVVLYGYVLHRGLLIGSHVGYTLDEPLTDCTDMRCSRVAGYKLYCTYWTASGTLREGGNFVYPTYAEAADRGSCGMFRN
jgi:hypothetical protein